MQISVVTPVLNGAKTISRLLDSLLVQRADFEHIVMDGGSRDETEEIVRSYMGRYNLKWYQKGDRSLYEGVLNGMDRTDGDILCYLNADDQYFPWTLATVRAAFESYPDVEWITGIPVSYSDVRGTAQTSSMVPHYPRGWIKRGWYAPGRLGCLQQESMFWKRSLWERSHPEEILLKYRLAADFNLWRRFAETASLRTVNSVLASFTISGGQVSWQRRDEYLQECGVKPGFDGIPLWGRVASRLACNLGQLRLLYIPDVQKR